MLIYSSKSKPIVDGLKAKGWGNDMIMCYVKYLEKKRKILRTGRTSSRDSARGKTYKAEWAFQNKCKDDIKEFSTAKEVQAYVKKVLKSKLWKDLTDGKQVSVHVSSSKKRIAGMAYGSRITISAMYGMDEYTVLHELAHCAGNMHHDVSFRACVLKLTSRFIGTKAAKVLKQEFRKEKLKLSLPTSYYDPETWLKHWHRMEKMRMKIAS
jgi:predicted metal-dependent hydrolase